MSKVRDDRMKYNMQRERERKASLGFTKHWFCELEPGVNVRLRCDPKHLGTLERVTHTGSTEGPLGEWLH